MGRMREWFTNFTNRKLEWALAIYSLLFGVMIALPPVSFSSENARGVLSIMNETRWGLLYAAAGMAHAVALHVNGRAAWTPFLRISVIFLNSQIFLAMALAFASANVWGTAVLTYGSMCFVFCLIAGHAAALDCGREWKIWNERNRDRVE